MAAIEQPFFVPDRAAIVKIAGRIGKVNIVGGISCEKRQGVVFVVNCGSDLYGSLRMPAYTDRTPVPGSGWSV